MMALPTNRSGAADARKVPRTMWKGTKAKIAAQSFHSKRRQKRDGAFRQRLLASLTPDAQVLDLGAGTGFLTLAMAERLTSGGVTAIDLSADMLQELRRQAEAKGLSPKITVRQTSVTNTGQDNESMDTVVSSYVLHELPDPEAALGEAFRVLRPGGVLQVKDYRALPLLGGVMRLLHPRNAHGPLSVAAVRELLARTGFREIQGEANGFLHFTASAIR